LVFAVDVTTWPRCDPECSPERGYYPSRHSVGQPIIAGWRLVICSVSKVAPFQAAAGGGSQERLGSECDTVTPQSNGCAVTRRSR
jgi:hypothetical protein